MVAERDLADHVDLNFGCPVPKVTRRGGGAALPYKRRLFEAIVRAAVDNAGADARHREDAHRDRRRAPHLPRRRAPVAADAGVAAVALHARTAAQRYSGTADWSAIARLRDALPAELPVLGNGDIFSAADALAMVAATGCDGVVVGRGCLGRPWLFGDLEAAFAGRPLPAAADARARSAATLRRHAELLQRAHGRAQGHPRHAQAHRLVPQGLPGRLRAAPQARAWSRASTSSTSCSPTLDPDAAVPGRGRRARAGGRARRAGSCCPEHWLDDPDDPSVPFGAELEHSGG